MFSLGSFEQRRPANQKRPFGGALADLAQRYGLMAVMAALIGYGSLYPFAFQASGSLAADISHLAGTWNRLPHSRGDILINLLLYMPFGFAAAQAIGWGRAGPKTVAGTVLLGAALSLSLELIQFYDHGRFSVIWDVYLNVAGTAVGAALGRAADVRRLRLSWPSGGTASFARILLVAWVGWQLFPYAPTIDSHKYWRSVQPLLQAATLEPYALFLSTVLWLSLIFLARAGLGFSLRWLLPVIAGFFLAKMAIIGQYILLPDIAGAGLALILCPLLSRRTWGIGMVAVLLAVVIVLGHILPWRLSTEPGAFQWVPFYGFLHGSLPLNIAALWQKFYLYGALLLLLVRMGLGLRTAAALECGILLVTGMLQIFLAGRSAEITDVIMVLMLALVYRVLRGASLEPSRDKA